MPLSPDLSGWRIVADEDVSFKVIKPLKVLGSDITTAPKGTKNGKFFKFARTHSRILLTHDNDFSDNFRYPPAKTKGVIIIKIHPAVETNILPAIQNLFRKITPESMKGKRVYLYSTGFEIE